MGDWSLLGDLVKTAREQSTLLGHIWLVILLLFRVLVLATVGNEVFQDEQEKFLCNTLQRAVTRSATTKPSRSLTTASGSSTP